MGEVYRARDSRLEREVAIKVLPAELASDDLKRKRFETEVRSASSLNHPNIVTIYDVGLEDGVPYMAMERVGGQTLRQILELGPVSGRKLLELATQIAEGLAKAHEAGIVHRDLKPENVMVTKEGLVKILDFGLAKQVGPVSGSDEGSHLPTETGTSPGVVLGTVGYMSPEQAGGQLVDFRSDQFSFGLILYEMATGKRAFQKDTAVDTLSAILHEEPNPVAEINPEAPAPLRWIVERCLAKDPEERFGTTRDLARDIASVRDHLSDAAVVSGAGKERPRRRKRLLWPGISVAAAVVIAAGIVILTRQTGRRTAPTGGPAPRIVVLPFENLGSPEDASFSAGITAEITSRLASVRSLAVISRTTATQYDRKGKTVEQIGKDLGVSYVLEGLVRWGRSGGSPGRVRITPQLIRVSDDTHLWTDCYDQQLSDIFAVQGEVADAVIGALN